MSPTSYQTAPPRETNVANQATSVNNRKQLLRGFHRALPGHRRTRRSRPVFLPLWVVIWVRDCRLSGHLFSPRVQPHPEFADTIRFSPSNIGLFFGVNFQVIQLCTIAILKLNKLPFARPDCTVWDGTSGMIVRIMPEDICAFPRCGPTTTQ